MKITNKTKAQLLCELEELQQEVEDECIQNAQKLLEVREATIEAMAAAIEMRDPYTAGHQSRVTDLAVAIAKEMDLSEDVIQGIKMAGIIHDIGKIQIPAEILTKPGHLSDWEFGLIQSHSLAGYNILKNIEFPWPVAKIVLQHHERLDGSGYPNSISGEEILLEARIISVADVIEAMESHRPYRSSHGVEIALEEIIQGKGILYDADAVDVCIKLFSENQLNLD
jgi:putative nucleotidyltransferase with HDIG domain